MSGKLASGISRRSLLGGALGIGVATAGGVALAGATSTQAQDSLRYDFFGKHQAGVVTPMQNHLHFAALDVTTKSRTQLISMLQAWTAASAAMTSGEPIGRFGAVNGPYQAPPEDTGEALELPPSGLTITIGFGPSLFDRFGLSRRRPETLVELPNFPGDQIDKSISGGDLCIQACADDAQVAVHAVRNLVRIGFGTAAVKWSQMGFGKSSATDRGAPTPRNLFGFKDGTANITEAVALDDFVWVQPGDQPDWMAGGTYLAVRKIRMTIETWDRTSLQEQEQVFGRTKQAGAPLSGGEEFTAPDFSAAGSAGQPLIPTDSHMALAHPDANGGQRILRRAYNYTDGSDGLGHLDAGLFFLAFQRDIADQFIPMQMRLSKSDRMNEYVRYISSSAFAIPPGVPAPGGYIGETLFEDVRSDR
ncbi:MAG: iron uptake transporter deferrochelatase/peroxidase subunit [Candidatus Nanopelagicales bacterium]|nr:iron uptake transporter deferrochelatase/peroxidase subunit [Candidatus Nanopelagicales bacterium]